MYTDFKEEDSVYKPQQADLTFPQAKRFSNFDDLRNELKRKLVVACRAFSYFKFDYGFAGHLTVRDPEFKDLYWTNPMAVHFKHVKISNLILVDHDGKVVEGNYSVNRAGFVLHAAVHKEYPDIVAMCHAHTLYGAAFASFGKKLDPISQDACAFYEDHNVITEGAGSRRGQ
jgi:ribulose-5-phosphate 4-epimerase/fuculose-1-phosphate aldolase